MIKVNVFDDENSIKVEKSPYYIVLTKEEYNDLKTRRLEEIYKYLDIQEKIQMESNVYHYEEIMGILSISTLDNPDYALFEHQLGERIYKIYKNKSTF